MYVWKNKVYATGEFLDNIIMLVISFRNKLYPHTNKESLDMEKKRRNNDSTRDSSVM
jgi:hypothetical protein